MSRPEDILVEAKTKAISDIKTYIFDLVAFGIVIALALASLNIFDFDDPSLMTPGEFIVGWLPYFLTTILLNADLYKKGVFIGKRTDRFCSVLNVYSEHTGKIKDEDLEKVDVFCTEFNDKTLKDLQIATLKPAGISYDDFIAPIKVAAGVEIQLRFCSKKQLQAAHYTNEQIRAIRKAKRLKVKGLTTMQLMSSLTARDATDTGPTERQLENNRMGWKVICYLATTVFLTFVGIKKLTEWGWVALIPLTFKVIYIAAGAMMSYFNGYNDITVTVRNSLIRKTDILRMFIAKRGE